MDANKVGEGCSGKGKKMYLLVMVNPGILKFERECKVLIAKPSLVLVNHIKEDKWRDVLCSNTSTSQSSPICSLQIIMSGVPESNASSQASRGSKRKWVPEEDAALVSCMVDLHNVGTFNADTGFKAGYLNELERMLQTVLLNAMLKAKPNIESRVRLLKREWSIVYDMLNGQNNSGFGWDEHRQLVVAEDTVWESYLKIREEIETKGVPHLQTRERRNLMLVIMCILHLMRLPLCWGKKSRPLAIKSVGVLPSRW
ncbi:hypothetical protein GOBAR_DD25390 [Gossypium barbadense]|nr:hypothetical protein GOBAR_DD25390 [Gossypium barbadense]